MTRLWWFNFRKTYFWKENWRKPQNFSIFILISCFLSVGKEYDGDISFSQNCPFLFVLSNWFARSWCSSGHSLGREYRNPWTCIYLSKKTNFIFCFLFDLHNLIGTAKLWACSVYLNSKLRCQSSSLIFIKQTVAIIRYLKKNFTGEISIWYPANMSREGVKLWTVCSNFHFSWAKIGFHDLLVKWKGDTESG